jgi:NADPH2:quinone reductase
VFGGYAEFLCVPAATVVPVPPGLDPVEAVCLFMNYVVAQQMLHRAARVQPGERILVHGAAGGVGTALLQLGGLAGLEMYGTASGGKHELVSGLGGIPIDYRREDFVARIFALTGSGVDAAFDPVGGPHFRRSYRTLRKGGRLVAYGVHAILTEGKLRSLSGLMSSFFLNLVPDGRRVLMYNVTRPKYSKPEWCREDLAGLFGLLAQEKIKPVIAERIPLVEAARAHELLERGAVTGKLVLLGA